MSAEVNKNFACPVCGERKVDNLVFVGEDIVQCSNCSTLYDVHTGKVVRCVDSGPDDVWTKQIYQEE